MLSAVARSFARGATCARPRTEHHNGELNVLFRRERRLDADEWLGRIGAHVRVAARQLVEEPARAGALRCEDDESPHRGRDAHFVQRRFFAVAAAAATAVPAAGRRRLRQGVRHLENDLLFAGRGCLPAFVWVRQRQRDNEYALA